MRRIVKPLLVSCVILSGLGADFSRFEITSRAQAKQRDKKQQTSRSRDLGDSIWTETRKPSKPSTRRRRYQRVGVTINSANAIKYEKSDLGSENESAQTGGRKSGAVWQDVALSSAGQVGVTIWRLRACAKGGDNRGCFLELKDEKDRTVKYEAVRVTTEADFRSGDGIQLAVESPVAGFIYVVHQEVYNKRRVGKPKLLYPVCGAGNAIGPGRPLLIPPQVAEEGIKVLKMQNGQGKGLVAERLKIIVASRPMEGICVQKDEPHYVGPDEVQRWESQWAGRLELFDLEGGDKENMTRNEWAAMRPRKGGRESSRDLTMADLAPQKLYLVERKRKDGVLITLDLPYDTQRVKARKK